MATPKKTQPAAKGRQSGKKAPPEPEKKRYGLGMILLVMFLSSGLFAALGVLAAHFGH